MVDNRDGSFTASIPAGWIGSKGPQLFHFLDGEGEELDDGEREAVELEAQQRVHARYQNMENMERLENEEELEKRLKERYAAHRDKYEGDGVADAVDQQALHPTVQDPKLWLVTV